MDFKDLANKAKDALGKNPNIIDKAGDFIDGKTDGKYSAQVDKAQDAAKKFAGGQQGQQDQQGPQGQQQ
ncbi:antitoxin [Tsukamurella tyrosinosolvens]|jgi:hypothetical protein|uniref:MT0933-like antitoxin protein n=2 Tax=Tsukamurella tyrosinosolvens TaxID=57704 RepID=A0A1H4NGL2_TSUTY|nr:antitoxin [Tsukamurella tyrosinosolvens]AUN39386.1 hypothetical protein ASU32_04620 [Tsukamurella tyrosinosolvens]KXO97108.1 hypothetical protein AXK58_07610 [Tsukamurella tyrosinosolvens]KXP02635.1 hypothetical protein AXK59_19180 [Tsukamurella tyrosinosolvens]KZL96773.1 hypothetical protein AXX05_14815 [Tsukamurella tyrosinosolvens]MCA4996691.1 antitoxin [Tsukamurella tyrosinosolvens]